MQGQGGAAAQQGSDSDEEEHEAATRMDRGLDLWQTCRADADTAAAAGSQHAGEAEVRQLCMARCTSFALASGMCTIFEEMCDLQTCKGL